MRIKPSASLLCVLATTLMVGSMLPILVSKLRAQQVSTRIAQIDNGRRSVLAGTRSPLIRHARDLGEVPADTVVHSMSIVFNRSPAQETALQALIAAQNNPASPLYHQWLTPDEFGARFGMSDADLAKAEGWLQEQGFTIDAVARGRNRITFSGTAAQVKDAFQSALHYYRSNGDTHYALSNDISLPAALASVTQSVSNMSTFRPKPRIRRPKAHFTSSQSGNHFLTPKDVATIYDINPAYNAGYNGAGQSIAVVGQTSVDLTDIENFQNAAGLPVKDPTLVLVPNSGNNAEFAGDESESDLDLEYSGGMAPGAQIYFVYVGDNANFSVWDSIQYAVDNQVAPIISVSYGICETALSPTQYSSLNAVLSQAATQGQSLIVPSGDSGSTDCYGVTGLTSAQQQALAVDFPASSQYVTAMGGTEFPATDVASTNTTYWQSASGNDVISSALSYIPEGVWNDNAPPSSNNNNTAILSSGGGGVSALTSPRPTWQAGVPGIPSGTKRLVPDIALSASPDNAGFLYCSSDPSIGVAGSCANGFRDSNAQFLTVAGGTSFDVPIFAGLVAVINQKENSVGQGIVASTLYSLASNSTTYANAFHDINNGNNNCSAAGSAACSGSGMTQYSATTGYDLASGLGSIDFNKLLNAWPAMTGSTLTPSRTTLSAASNAPAVGANDSVIITVASGSGSVTSTPSGTLNVVVDGSNAASALALSNGSATYNFVSSAGGSHVITAVYSGDSTFAASTSTLVVGNQGFRLVATSPTITAGGSGTSTLTITPQEGYTGSIAWNVSASPAFTNGCYSLQNATVSSSSPVTVTMTINTSASGCGAAALLRTPAAAGTSVASADSQPKRPLRTSSFGFAIAGLLLGGVFMGSRGRGRGIAGLCLLFVLTLGLPGCGGGSSSPPPVTKNVARGTYNLTVVGTDTANSSISSSAVVTVTIN